MEVQMGVCKKCGKPIMTEVNFGSGVYPDGLCWNCFETEKVDIIHFDYYKNEKLD